MNLDWAESRIVMVILCFWGMLLFSDGGDASVEFEWEVVDALLLRDVDSVKTASSSAVASAEVALAVMPVAAAE